MSTVEDQKQKQEMVSKRKLKLRVMSWSLTALRKIPFYKGFIFISLKIIWSVQPWSQAELLWLHFFCSLTVYAKSLSFFVHCRFLHYMTFPYPFSFWCPQPVIANLTWFNNLTSSVYFQWWFFWSIFPNTVPTFTHPASMAFSFLNQTLIFFM